MNLEAKLLGLSIIPYTESRIRDTFTSVLEEKFVATAREVYLDERCTVFRGRIDLQQPGKSSHLAAVVSPSVPENDGGDVKGASVELKRMMEQATQQCLAECHTLLSTLTITSW